MGLAHSTVSGIVTRLEQRGLLQRTTRAEDRRTTSIGLTDPVKQWVKDDLMGSRLRPIVAALERATEAERAAILTGLATLERLIERSAE
jgi:DNA-binding MarR family transcriptional regulator